jgi:nucleotide-binding universal stress UspA family protein
MEEDMRLLQKILLPTDFSRSSEDAVNWAVTLAKIFDSEIILVHVLPDDTNLEMAMDVMMLKKAAHNQLNDIRKKISRNWIKTTEPIIAKGSPFNQIVQLANSFDVNLILMGSGEKESGDKFKLGITVDKVIRKSTKPVWVIKQGMVSPIKRILCPVDFSTPSFRALKNGIHLARKFEAELMVLNIVAPVNEKLTGLELQFATAVENISKIQHSHYPLFLKNFDFHNVNWSKKTCRGEPFTEILKVISEQNSDLLVMGTTGKTGLNKILIGSVTEKVIREVPCSFITMKSEDVIKLRIEEEIKGLESSLKQGAELLEHGFAKEALTQFKLCIILDDLFAPAWEGLAVAHKRMGDKKEEQQCMNQAKEIRERLWHQQN